MIGGGNTALDVARVVRRLGAEVTVLYRRTAEEMPAIREEYHHAVADGVVFEWLTLPRSVEEGESGLVVTVEEMRLGDPDGSGRRRPEPTGRIRRLGFSDRWPPCRPAAVVGPDEVNPSYRSDNRRTSDPTAHTIDPLGEETFTVAGEDVLAEIERCLSCGHCNACGTCFVFCPDGAIRWEEGGPVIDLEFCKGCGICVVECPGRALVLINEREAIDA